MLPSALAAMAQWIEHWPVNQRIASSIPSQGTCLGCGPGPQLGTGEGLALDRTTDGLSIVKEGAQIRRLFLKDFIYLFLGRGERREKER